MAARTNTMISDFSAKPETRSFYEAIDAFVQGLGPVTRTARSQVSYGANRKFLWMWAYERTADGTLYLNVPLDRPEHHDGVHNLTRSAPTGGTTRSR